MALLREFGPGLWVAEGPAVTFLPGFPYPTRMAIIRLADGGLFVWSPIALSPELQAEVEVLGKVRHLVSPNKLHHLFLGEWKAAYPAARLYAPPGLRRRRRNLVFDVDLETLNPLPWAGEIGQIAMRGSFVLTEIVFFHQRSRTAIFADLIQNFSPGWFKGIGGWLARMDGITAPYPGAPREWRCSFFGRKAARAALESILAWPIERVLIAHGEPQEANGHEFVARAFAWLKKPAPG